MRLPKPGIATLFAPFVLFASSSTAAAIGYSDFPPDLQQILDQRIAELDAEGGMCVAGRVTLSDGRTISSGADVMVNLYDGWDEPLWVYPDGWFIMGRTGSSYYTGPGIGFVLRAFGYDPIDAEETVLEGQMTYLEFQMQKTPPEDLASVTGTVTDEGDHPFNGAGVGIAFPFANHGYNSSGYTYPHMAMTTGADGQYAFDGLSISEHRVVATASEYAYHIDYFTPPVGGIAVQDRKLYPVRRIIVDYVYQADGSRSFTSGELQSATIDWLVGSGGLDFSDARVEGYESGDLRDLELRQDQDIMRFDVFYVNGHNGFYDAGPVDFDSITEAAVDGYSTSSTPCTVGHVYVVRTYEEDNYAKLIVISDESSFRTIPAGDPEPMEFVGYGLTIDFSYCSEEGRLYARKHFAVAGGLQSTTTLPYYWDLSGMFGVTFSADLTFHYDESELASLGLREDTLMVFSSSDEGLTWEALETQRDLLQDTVQADGISSFSWFALVSVPFMFPGPDFDGDTDVDMQDFGHLQACLSGENVPQSDPTCENANLDGDNDVDQDDMLLFRQCLTAPTIAADPHCLD